MRKFVSGALIAGGLCCSSVQSVAAAPSYLGNWRVTSSRPAPWVGPDDKPYIPDMKRLMGQVISFTPTRIVAPQPLTCRGPIYRIKVYPRDMLFQGGLTDAARQAKALGFAGAKITTLETGCEGLIDFHFVNPSTAFFALNNRLYRIVKVKP
jgi:hypothetical protein